jgi:hypothetical protein
MVITFYTPSTALHDVRVSVHESGRLTDYVTLLHEFAFIKLLLATRCGLTSRVPGERRYLGDAAHDYLAAGFSSLQVDLPPEGRHRPPSSAHQSPPA